MTNVSTHHIPVHVYNGRVHVSIEEQARRAECILMDGPSDPIFNAPIFSSTNDNSGAGSAIGGGGGLAPYEVVDDRTPWVDGDGSCYLNLADASARLRLSVAERSASGRAHGRQIYALPDETGESDSVEVDIDAMIERDMVCGRGGGVPLFVCVRVCARVCVSVTRWLALLRASSRSRTSPHPTSPHALTRSRPRSRALSPPPPPHPLPPTTPPQAAANRPAFQFIPTLPRTPGYGGDANYTTLANNGGGDADVVVLDYGSLGPNQIRSRFFNVVGGRGGGGGRGGRGPCRAHTSWIQT